MRKEGGIKKRGPVVLREDLHKRSEIRTTLGNPNYIKLTPHSRKPVNRGASVQLRMSAIPHASHGDFEGGSPTRGSRDDCRVDPLGHFQPLIRFISRLRVKISHDLYFSYFSLVRNCYCRTRDAINFYKTDWRARERYLNFQPQAIRLKRRIDENALVILVKR